MTASPPTTSPKHQKDWQAGPARVVIRVVLVVCAVLGTGSAVVSSVDPHALDGTDLDINLVAAERLVAGEPLYDASASRARAVELGGPTMEQLYTLPTNSFAGLPSTALLHVPATIGDHRTEVLLFRLTTLAGMVGAVALVARTLPRGRRLDGFLAGAAVLGMASATFRTLMVGQGHHMVMLALAVAMWGTARRRWAIVGVAIGVAALLKVGPGILLVLLLLRTGREARTRLLAGFVSAVVGLTATAAAVGRRPGDVVVWAREVLPGLSAGVVRTENQSLPAALERLVVDPSELVGTAGVGPIRMIAAPLLLLGALALWRVRRGAPVDVRELGILVLLVIVVGPLTWDHYATWACLPLVLLVTTTRRELLVGAMVAAALLAMPVARPSGDEVAASWTLRLTTSPGLGAVMVLLVALSVDLYTRPAGAVVAAPDPPVAGPLRDVAGHPAVA